MGFLSSSELKVSHNGTVILYVCVYASSHVCVCFCMLQDAYWAMCRLMSSEKFAMHGKLFLLVTGRGGHMCVDDTTTRSMATSAK